MQWKRSFGCGGRRIYELVGAGLLLAVVQRDPDWWVWLPGEQRPLISQVATLRKAKSVAERYFAARERSRSKANRRHAAPARSARARKRQTLAAE